MGEPSITLESSRVIQKKDFFSKECKEKVGGFLYLACATSFFHPLPCCFEESIESHKDIFKMFLVY